MHAVVGSHGEVGHGVLFDMGDAATAAGRFPTQDAAERFRACAPGMLENCVTDTEAPTPRGPIRLRDALLVGAGLAVGWMACSRMG